MLNKVNNNTRETQNRSRFNFSEYTLRVSSRRNPLKNGVYTIHSTILYHILSCAMGNLQ